MIFCKCLVIFPVTLSEAKSLRHPNAMFLRKGFFVVSLLRMTASGALA